MTERAAKQSASAATIAQPAQGPTTVPAPSPAPAAPAAGSSEAAPVLRSPSRPVVTPTPQPTKTRRRFGRRHPPMAVVRSPTTPSKPARPPRRARLRLTRIDPWSVMKTAFLLSIALAVVTVVAVVVVWSVLGAAGVWTSVNSTVQGLIGEESAGFDVENYVGMSRVLGFTLLVSAIDIVLLTALATLAAFLYNMSAALLGGIEITLVEDN